MKNYQSLETEQKNVDAVSKAFKCFQRSFTKNANTDVLLDLFFAFLNKEIKVEKATYDYLWGGETQKVEGVTKNHIPRLGDTCIFDISVLSGGVWIDVTRTFFVGNPTSAHLAAFEVVKQSIRSGEKILTVGETAKNIFSAVNGTLSSFGNRLIHHAGHRIAEKPVAEPEFILGNNQVIKNGIYAIESGVYDKFGLRLENNYYVNDNQAVNISEYFLPLNIGEYILR